MYALYDENGDFKVGTILSEAESSVQLEALHGKRAKIKATHVLLRFKEPAPGELLPHAQSLAEEMDVAFLWEASGADEFGFQDFAREYFGRPPSSAEAAAVLLKVHAAPVYFHRKGRGRFRAAPAELLQTALAAQEKKRQREVQIEAWAEQLRAFTLPEALRPHLRELLYKPDRNRSETKALELACTATGLTSARLLERCGALPPSHDYHLGRFLFECFPAGTGFPSVQLPAVPVLPLAAVQAFSIDDKYTTEIDDAVSLSLGEDGSLRLGIHIAAPALAFNPESPLGNVARERLSTVYMPGNKITMLPPTVIEHYTLAAGSARAALSLYVELDPTKLTPVASWSRLEQVPIAANLRHEDLESLNPALAQDPDGPLPPTIVPVALVEQVRTLYRVALALEAARGETGNFERPEYSFHVADDRITITERKRGAPIDKLVAELMILANSTWGKLLADQDVAAIYRVQSQGKVRMTTTPGEHQGLGVANYAWSSSPLRRYVDLVNQWQLLAHLDGRAPPYARNSASLLGAIRDFELTYAAYAEFQDRMEHYWCLRWLLQEGLTRSAATVVRENVVKFRDLPLYVRVPSLPELAVGSAVTVEIVAVDLIDATLNCVYVGRSE